MSSTAAGGNASQSSSNKSKPTRSSLSRITPAIPRALDPKQKVNKRAPSPETAPLTEDPQDPPKKPEVSNGSPTETEDNKVTTVTKETIEVSPQAINGSLTPKTITKEIQPVQTQNQTVADGQKSDVSQGEDHVVPPSTVAPADTHRANVPQAVQTGFMSSPQDSQHSKTATNSSSRDPSFRSGMMNQFRPNSGNMVFGGNRDSASSSPAPPINSAVPHLQPSQVGHPGFSLPYHGPQPFPPHTHSYHVSEPFAGPMYPSYGPYSQHPNQHNFIPENFSSNTPRHGREFRHQHPPRPFYPRRPEDMHYLPRYVQYQAPPPPRFPVYDNQTFSPTKLNGSNENQARPIQAGLPTSHIKPQEANYETRAQADSPVPYRSVPPTASTPSFSINNIKFLPPEPSDAETLAIYIRTQFGNRESADLFLRFHYTDYTNPVVIPSHAMIISRSPRLQSILSMHTGSLPFQSHKTLDIPVTDRFMLHELAITKGIAHLYADPLPGDEFLSTIDTSVAPDRPILQHKMAFSLAFAATGHFLQLDELVSHGLKLAVRNLAWDTMEKALAFALEGGLSSTWLSFDASNSEDRGSCSSSFEDTPSKLDSPTSTPAYGFYSDRLLNHIMQFLVDNIPTDISFISTAPQLPETPRLPLVAETPTPAFRTNSRLNHIRFGEMSLDEGNNNNNKPTNDTTKTTSETANPTSESIKVLISSILLSLPFPALKSLLENPGLCSRLSLPTLTALARDVIQERETRRRRAADAKRSIANIPSTEERQWHNTRWMELVDTVAPSQGHAGSVKLLRQRLGAETPSLSPET